MATDDVGNLLNAGIQAAKAGEKAKARRLFEQVLEIDDNNEAAWMWFASVVDTPRERRICLENVLEINPNNQRAREALEKLGPAPTNTGTMPAVNLPPKSEPIRSAPIRPPVGSAPSASSTSRMSGRSQALPPLQPKRRSNRLSTTSIIIAAATAIALMALGFLLIFNTPTSGPVTPTAVVAANVTRVTGIPITPNAVVVTFDPANVTAPPSWTPPPTATALPTQTATATLPPMTNYSFIYVGEGRDRKDPGLYAMDGGSSTEKLLVSAESPAYDVDVSKSGKIAYVTTADGAPQVAVANADGSNSQVITKLTGKTVRRPMWSPDEKLIAFTSDESGFNQIYTIKPDGTEQTRLTNNKFEDQDAAWSPDGSKIAYSTEQAGKKSLQIFVMDLKSKKLTQLTASPNDNTSPVWSPDGKMIAFVSTRDRFPNVYVMNADGTVPRLLTIGGGSFTSRDPSWSPDGKFVVFASNRSQQIYNLFTVTLDGKNIQQITKQESNTYGARFRPKQS